jgi:hypothetical protein
MSETEPAISILGRLELYFSLRHTLHAIRLFAGAFDDDYDLAIIFLAVVESGLKAIFHHVAVNAEEIDIDAVHAELANHGLSILNISGATAIPRETVRRKLRYLVDKGYLDVSRKDRSLFVLRAAISNPKILEIMNKHVADVGALVRTIQFYSQEPAAPAAPPTSAKVLSSL